MAKLITAQSDKHDILLEPLEVHLQHGAILKEFAASWSSQTNNIYDSTHLLKLDVSGRKVNVNTK